MYAWRDYQGHTHETLWSDFPSVIPFSVIDERLVDLALSLGENPDDKTLAGYRRLEDEVRERTGVAESEIPSYFATVFGERAPKLRWAVTKDGERVGRLNLFTGAYMAHRNPKAHSELGRKGIPWLPEFCFSQPSVYSGKDSARGQG